MTGAELVGLRTKENERQQNDDFLSERKFDDENFHFSYI
jgi:hypothetical protein